MEDDLIIETAYLQLYDCTEFQSQKVDSGLTKGILAGKAPVSSSGNVKTLKIQFNPSTLKFHAGQTVQKQKKDISKSEGGKVKQADVSEKTKGYSVSMKLMFDRTLYIDNSVLSEVEGFLAIVKNPYIRQVTFNWGTLHYKGKVKSVSADYVMFGKDGTPTRATVELTIDVD